MNLDNRSQRRNITGQATTPSLEKSGDRKLSELRRCEALKH
jgi:hypothetical protein